jgi:sugar lactone lactonase YvrE
MVARLLSCLILVLALTVLAGPSARRTQPAVQAARALQTVAMVGGQPDDITADARGDLIWSDLARGTVERLSGGRITTLARGLSVPEGVVALPGGAIVVAEQGRDRLVRIERSGEKTVLYTLQPVPGQEGVDGIGRDPRTGELLIPDSPRGTVLRLSPDGRRVRVIARGLGRPVDAASDARGTILVPDEHLGTLVVIRPRGTVAYRGALSTPDDVAIDRAGRVWLTTLGDGGLWTIAPGTTAPRRVLMGLATPQGLTLDRCGDPIVVEQNTARIVRLLLTPTAARCPR